MSLSKSKSIIKLNDFPEEILKMIMLFMPLQIRISKRVVCHKWKRIIEDTFRRVRSLKLFDSFNILTAHYCPLLLARGHQGDRDLVLSKHESDDLVLGGTLAYEYEDFTRDILTEGRVLNIAPSGDGHFPVNLFPNVDKLVVATLHNSNRIDFDHLLNHFGPKLTTLSFSKVRFENFVMATSFRDLGPVLGSLSNLRALHLHDATFGTNRQILAQSSPILPHLETLSLMILDPWLVEFNFLKQTRSLKHLSIDGVASRDIDLFDSLSQAQLASQLESLSIGWFSLIEFPLTTLVDSLCTHFGSIRTLRLNLSDRQHPNVDDPQKTLNFIITQLGRLTKLVNLYFKIESDYFDITSRDVAKIPVMKNILHLKVALLNTRNFYVARRVNQLERCLLVIFPNATRILLATPYRERADWQVGRDRLVQMVEHNAPIMRMDGTEEVEVDVAPLLGRHEDMYRRECLGEGQFGLYEVAEEEKDSEDDENEEENNEDDNFLGISIELLTLLSDEETVFPENPFFNGSLLEKLKALKRILSTHTRALNHEYNYAKLLIHLNITFGQHVTRIETRQIALLALECIRLIAAESKPGSFPMYAKKWISYLLFHFGSNNVLGRVVELMNAALDAICRAIPFGVMVAQVKLPLVHPLASVRKASAQFLYRALSQVERERIINGEPADRDNHVLVCQLLSQLVKANDLNACRDVRNLLRMAISELDYIVRLRQLQEIIVSLR